MSFFIQQELIIFVQYMIQNPEKINQYNQAYLINQINQDLRIRNYYLQPTQYFTNYQHSKLFSNQRLMQTLIKRNKQFQKKLVDVKMPLTEELRQLQKNVNDQIRRVGIIEEDKQTRAQIGRQINSQINWERFTVANQQQYTDKHQEYLIHSLIQKSMKDTNQIEKQQKAKIKSSLLGIKDQNAEIGSINSQSILHSILNRSLQSISTASVYNNFIEKHVQNRQTVIPNIEQFVNMNTEMKHVWKIISAYMKTYDEVIQNNTGDPKIAIIKTAIQLIGDQFKSQMPSINKDNELNDYIRKKFIHNIRTNDFQNNQEGNLLWGIPYVLFRSGVWYKFTYSLNNCGKNGAVLREHFLKFKESLDKLAPSPQYFLQAPIADIFYKQLVNIAKGGNFSEELYQKGSLDLIWLLLITQKIYEHRDKSKQLQLQNNIKNLLEYFILNQQDLRNPKGKYLSPYTQFLYLGAYQKLFQYHEKCHKQNRMKMQDYLHFLLVLQSRSALMSQKSYKKLIQHLKIQLKSYISNLLSNNQQQKNKVIFYICKIPKQSFESVILDTISNWTYFSIVNRFNIDGENGWKNIKANYVMNSSQEIFQNTMVSLLKNLSLQEETYDVQDRLIDSAQQLLNTNNSIYYLLQTLCRNLMNLAKQNKPQKQTVRFCQRVRERLQERLQIDLEVKQQYQPLINFINSYCTIDKLFRDNIQKKISQFLNNEQYVENLSQLVSYSNFSSHTSIMLTMYNQLAKFDALELFYIYLKKVILSKENDLLARGFSKKLEAYKENIRLSLKVIKQKNAQLEQILQYYLQL